MKSLRNIRNILFAVCIGLGVLFIVPGYALALESVPAGTTPTAAEERPILVYYNDEALSFHIDPVIIQDTTLVEFRTIFEKLGLEITWINETRTIIGKKEGLTVELKIGSPVAKVNGAAMELQIAPTIVNERTAVPLRFVGEAAGSYVKWDGANRTIHLYRIGPDSLTTGNNRVQIQGKVPADIRWVRFDIVKDGSESIHYEYVQPQSGKVDYELYLPDGSGGYRIHMHQTKAINKRSILYQRYAEFSVTNYGNSGLHPDSDTTGNSRLHLSGELLADVKTVLLIITHHTSEQSKQIFLAPGNGMVDKDIYLSLGEGSYTIDIYTTAEPPDNRRFEKLQLLKSLTVFNSDTRDPDLMPSEMVESEHTEIVQLAEQIVQGLETDSAKSRAIYDWVAANIVYDAATFLSGGDRVDSALETLRGRLTDCDGYARLNAALHRAAGIKARIIVGTVIDLSRGETWDQIGKIAPNHAWNEVFADGRWIIQDPTWGAGYIDRGTSRFVPELDHTYYDPTPEKFALDHKIYTDLKYKYE